MGRGQFFANIRGSGAEEDPAEAEEGKLGEDGGGEVSEVARGVNAGNIGGEYCQLISVLRVGRNIHESFNGARPGGIRAGRKKLRRNLG